MGKLVHTHAPPSERQIQACTPFGIELRVGPCSPRSYHDAAHQLRTALAPGQVALLTGPSGSGKSCTLRSLADQLRRRSQRVITPPLTFDDSRLLINVLDLSVERTLAFLAAFGLAEPALAARRICELSEGQQHRVRLALAFHQAQQTRARWVLVDEFCSVLDRITAHGVAATIARAARCASVRVVCATAHDDLTCHLRPDVHIAFDLTGAWSRCPGASRDESIIIEPGSCKDMHRLLCHHYLAGPPATRVGFLRAHDRAHDQLAGVLVISMPTLNGAWRAQAWPGRYAGPDRKAALARMNAELRCISRVIVDPRYRGRGIARRLVQHYLNHPLTPATEAIAAMGSICPFFEQAGMIAYHVPFAHADARLADALDACGFAPWMLADAQRASSIIRVPLVARELDRWARTRRVQAPDPIERARLAGARLCVRPMAYAAVFPPNAASNRRPEGGPSAKESDN
ncbi:MAG: GNAT family N-acetyltransferase [Planctomycetota bacterium]|nr:MAG: GNAT family N-acetyltransferase [Planctomycetota bacterium]